MKEDLYNLQKLPSLEDIEAIIAEIKAADLKTLSFNKLFKKLQAFQFIPFPTALLKKDYHIERARINKFDEVFYSEKDISYRTDYDNITKYGRANFPGNSLFYGAFKSDLIEQPRLVNLFETSEIFRDLENNSATDADFIMTVGKWKILEDIEVVEIVFDETSIENSREIERAFNYHVDKLSQNHPEYKERLESILRFFSNEFAKKEIKDHSNYMISALYSYLGIEGQGHNGIKYPSVKTNYEGHNVALTPAVVENFLELDVVAMFRVIKTGKETIITPIKICTDFGPMNTNFKWDDAENQKLITV